MKIRTTLAVAVAAASLHSFVAPAQNLFRVTFQASYTSLNGGGSRLTTANITEKDIIANATGATGAQHLPRGFALAYNTAADSLQVVDTNGNVVADVINFAGGASVSDGKSRDRLTFMFVPGLTNAIGSAILTEGTGHISSRAAEPRANIVGKLQFALVGSTVLGSTNPGTEFNPPNGTNSPSGNFFMTSAYDDATAKVCVGTFFTKEQLAVTVTTTNAP